MLKIENRIGIPESKNSGIDTLEDCLNRKHFLSYPKDISYRYNSRGFRDHEWPQDLSDVIWCLGDSFTVGIGQPFQETWPQLLEKKLGKRCLNLGEDGCTNDTLSMRTEEICRLHKPKLIVVMWSYLHRRRINNKNLHSDKSSFGVKEDMTNFIKNYQTVNQLPTNVINLTIPHAFTSPDTINYFLEKKTEIESPNVIHFDQVDWARDYHHFDVQTSRNVVELIFNNIK